MTVKAGIMTTLLGGVLLGACSVIGVRSGTEQPHAVLVERIGSLEIRRYDRRLAAETRVAGDEIDARSTGFRRLAGYIFGGNEAGTHIAMTAPVSQFDVGSPGQRIAMTAPVASLRAPDGSWLIRFFLPASLTEPPRPRDDRVVIAVVPPETMAVRRFSGVPGAAAVARQIRTLEAALPATGWRQAGSPVAWFYDPPWTIPPLRRNEVAVPVTR